MSICFPESSKGKIVIISGPSGGGKTNIVNTLLLRFPIYFKYGTSYTTRKPRPLELDGINYHFITVDAFRQGIEEGKFIEWEEVYPEIFYGTGVEDILSTISSGKNYITELDVLGARSIKERFGDQALVIFLVPPDIKTLEERLRGRNDLKEEEFKYRLDKAIKEIRWGKEIGTFEVIENREWEETVKEVESRLQKFLSL